MDIRAVKQSTIIKNPSVSNEIKNFFSENRTLKLSHDDSNQIHLNHQKQSNVDSNQTNQQKGEQQYSIIPKQIIQFNKLYSTYTSNKNGNQLTKSDIISKNSSTQNSLLIKSMQSSMHSNQKDNQNRQLQNKNERNSQILCPQMNNKIISLKDNTDSYQNSLYTQKSLPLEQNQEQLYLHLSGQSTSTHKNQTNKNIQKNIRQPFRTNSASHRFLTETSTNEQPYYKEEQNQNIEMLYSTNQKLVKNLTGSFIVQQQQQSGVSKRPTTSQVINTKSLSKELFQQNNNHDVYQHNKNKDIYKQQINYQINQIFKNKTESSEKYQLEIDQLDSGLNIGKKPKAISTSFQSNNSGQDIYGNEKNDQDKSIKEKRSFLQLQNPQIPSKSILGSTQCTNSANSTPVSKNFINHPKQITQQLVRQNLMIFNRKEQFQQSNQKNSNNYTVSQKIIYQQSQNRNLFKHQLSQNSNAQSFNPYYSMFQNRDIVIESEITPLTTKSLRLQTFSEQIDSEKDQPSTKFLLSKSILGFSAQNKQSKQDIRDSLSKEYPKLTRKINKNKDTNDDMILLSPSPENSYDRSKVQKVDTEKQSFIKELIQKKNARQIALIDAPYFQNKVIPEEITTNIQNNQQLNNQIQKVQIKDNRQRNNNLSNQMKLNHLSVSLKLNNNQSQPIQCPNKQITEQHNQKQQNDDNNLVETQDEVQINQDEINQLNYQHNDDDSQNQQNIQFDNSESAIENYQTNFQQRCSLFSKNQNQKGLNKQQSLIKQTEQTDSSPGEQFLQKLSPRPQTAIAYNRVNSQQSQEIPQNPHEQFLSKVLYSERNSLLERFKGVNQSQTHSNSDQQYQIFELIDSQKPLSASKSQKLNYQKQILTKSKTKPIDNDNNSVPQYISPWQNSIMSDQQGEDDSFDFIQYTISS